MVKPFFVQGTNVPLHILAVGSAQKGGARPGWLLRCEGSGLCFQRVLWPWLPSEQGWELYPCL